MNRVGCPTTKYELWRNRSRLKLWSNLALEMILFVFGSELKTTFLPNHHPEEDCWLNEWRIIITLAKITKDHWEFFSPTCGQDFCRFWAEGSQSLEAALHGSAVEKAGNLAWAEKVSCSFQYSQRSKYFPFPQKLIDLETWQNSPFEKEHHLQKLPLGGGVRSPQKNGSQHPQLVKVGNVIIFQQKNLHFEWGWPSLTRCWFQFSIFTPKIGEDFQIWAAYFSDGLVQPPTS